MTSTQDIPVAHTPAGGYGDVMPAPVLAGCNDPVVSGAPDLDGTWRVVDVRSNGEPLPDGHDLWAYVERVEQAGNRVVVTGGGVVHDMVVDGTYEHGVNDVMAIDFATPITVAATYEDGALVLRPRGAPNIEVRRRREGDELVWVYHTLFTARLVRVDL